MKILVLLLCSFAAFGQTVTPGPGNAGTVTSVAETFTGGLISVGGSPVTGSGTLALTVAGTSGGIPYFSSTSAWASSGLLASGQFVLGGGAGATPTTSFSVVPVANGGTGIASGTSGGILAYTASGTLASSGALTANLPVIGGGAGVAPTVGTRSGNTTAYVTTTGAQTSGNSVSIDASGNHIASGLASGAATSVALTGVLFAALGTPAAGTLQYCSDCTVVSGVDNTCAGSGTGALAIRLNGAHKCVQ